LADLPRIYWDACSFLGLLNREAARHDDCEEIYNLAENGRIELWTSTLTYVEVFKKKCEGKARPLDESGDENIEGFLLQDFIYPVEVNREIGVFARKLMRRLDIPKPQDAVHLATAVLFNLDEFHTYDGSDLLKLDRLINRSDGQRLFICTPANSPFRMSASNVKNENQGRSAQIDLLELLAGDN
jgi:predicted nucleic acid-binding protein